jgi:hypothetical protein
MTTQGLAHVYLETHNWGKTVAFWEALGFKLEFATDHNSGRLVAANGTSLFVAERAPLDPPGTDIYLEATEAGPAPEGVEVVFDWSATHWSTQVMTVRDPDGRLIRLEAPAPPGS